MGIPSVCDPLEPLKLQPLIIVFAQPIPIDLTLHAVDGRDHLIQFDPSRQPSMAVTRANHLCALVRNPSSFARSYNYEDIC